MHRILDFANFAKSIVVFAKYDKCRYLCIMTLKRFLYWIMIFVNEYIKYIHILKTNYFMKHNHYESMC